MLEMILTVQYENDNKISKHIGINLKSALIIDKYFLEGNNFNSGLISNIDIRLQCKDFPVIVIDNTELDIKHYGIASYLNHRSSIAVLKLYNIDLIHINDMDITHIETKNASPLIVRCNINELYTGIEINDAILNDTDTITLLKYKVDIRRDTNINHFSGYGTFDLNIQESYIKELSLHGVNYKEYINEINNLSIWNGSKVTNFTLGAITNHLKIADSSVDMLNIGKCHIKKIELHNEIIGRCLIDEESIDSDDIARWILAKKSAVQNGNRNDYLNASYLINRKYAAAERKWFKKLLLNTFDLICGYGYKPWRTIISSFAIIIFCAIIFWLIGLSSPHSFNIASASLSFIDCIYYSGITYTTTGYGDIVPIINVVKIISILEAILGVSMLSLFIFSLTKSLTEHTQN